MNRDKPNLILSRPTLDGLRRHALPGSNFISTAEPRGDGLFNVAVGEDVAERIDQKRLPGESDDDVVRRLVEMADSGGAHH